MDFNFLKNFITKPFEVGTLIPMSAKAVDEFLQDVPTKNIRHIVELGAGNGAVTDQLIDRCDKLTLVELNLEFVDILHQKYDKFKHVVIVYDDAAKYMERLCNDDDTDVEYIICTLPFTNMPCQISNDILKNVKQFCEKNLVIFVAIQLSRFSKGLFDNVFGYKKLQYRYTEESFLPFKNDIFPYTVVTYLPPPKEKEKTNTSIISIAEKLLQILMT